MDEMREAIGKWECYLLASLNKSRDDTTEKECRRGYEARDKYLQDVDVE